MKKQKRGLRSRSVTMRDVAEYANVSQSTVSRVLNRSVPAIPIGAETRQRVLDAVEELGYYPNLHAGSLRGQKTRLIAVLIADIANPFYHAIARAIQDYAHAERYDVLIANSDHKQENERLFCEAMIRRPVDGIIAVPSHVTADELADLAWRTGAAIAVLGQHINHPSIDTVACNDSAATYEAVQWLLATRGQQRVGFIGVMEAFHVGLRRQEAYQRALADAGLCVRPEYVQIGDWSVESGARAMRAFLALPEPPTAVFACNDHMAIGAILAAEEQGVRVPADVAVMGFDNIPAASWIRPRLTTIAQYPTEIGRQLAQAIFERIEGKETGDRRLFEIPCTLITRESA